MITDIVTFILYAFEQHRRDGHAGGFDGCRRRNCKRARQLEVYLILMGRWVEAALRQAQEGPRERVDRIGRM